MKPLTVFTISMLITVFSFAKVDYASNLNVNGEEYQIGNYLEWITSSEENSEFFFIEKSTDRGQTFETIGKRDAAGVSSQNKAYRFLDFHVTDKIVWYRLKQTDLDGRAYFSEMVKVEKKIPNSFVITDMSNFMTELDFILTLNILEESILDIKLTNFKGKVISNKKVNYSPGMDDLIFNMENEEPGQYKVTLSNGIEMEEVTFIKKPDALKKKSNMASKK